MRVIVSALILFMCLIVSCGGGRDRKEEVKREEARKQEELRRNRLGDELAKKHNAVTDWDKGLIRYTIQLQNLLVDHKRPVFFRGHIVDVFREDGQCYVRFIEGMISPGGLDFLDILEARRAGTALRIYFVLKHDCDNASKMASTLETEERDKENAQTYWREKVQEYAVVARVNDIQRPALHIDIKSRQDGVDLDYEPSNFFIAMGDCIELVHLGESYLW